MSLSLQQGAGDQPLSPHSGQTSPKSVKSILVKNEVSAESTLNCHIKNLGFYDKSGPSPPEVFYVTKFPSAFIGKIMCEWHDLRFAPGLCSMSPWPGFDLPEAPSMPPASTVSEMAQRLASSAHQLTSVVHASIVSEADFQHMQKQVDESLMFIVEALPNSAERVHSQEIGPIFNGLMLGKSFAALDDVEAVALANSAAKLQNLLKIKMEDDADLALARRVLEDGKQFFVDLSQCAQWRSVTAWEFFKELTGLKAKEEKEAQAATKIQAALRGRASRKNNKKHKKADKLAKAQDRARKEQEKKMVEEIEAKNEEERHTQEVEWLAAVKIQSVKRGQDARKLVAEEKKARTEAAVKIQKIARQRAAKKVTKAKREESNRTKAAKKIQKQARKRKGIITKTAPQIFPKFWASMRPADISPAMTKIRELDEDQSQQHASFRQSCIGLKGAEYLAAVIKPHQSLTSIDLQGNFICDGGAQRIAAGLLKNKMLTEMNLSWNSIGDMGAAKLGVVICKTKVLSRVNLAYNRIGDLGSECLALSIDTNPHTTLKELNLEGNRMTRMGVDWLTEACAKTDTKLQVPTYGMVENTVLRSLLYRSYEQVVERFLIGPVPQFLKDTLAPILLERFRKAAEAQGLRDELQASRENYQEGISRVDTGLRELQSRGIKVQKSTSVALQGVGKIQVDDTSLGSTGPPSLANPSLASTGFATTSTSSFGTMAKLSTSTSSLPPVARKSMGTKKR